MLPDFPIVKKRAGRSLLRHMSLEVLRRSPILKEIPRVCQHEGEDWAYGQRGEEEITRDGYRKIETEFSMTRDEARAGDIKRIFDKIGDMAEKVAETQTKHMFGKMSEAAESAGNVVKADGPLTPDNFLEVLSRVESDFDPLTRRPKNSFMVMHPDLLKKVLPKMERWGRNPEFKKRLSEIEEKKWLAWRDRESRRRLVD